MWESSWTTEDWQADSYPLHHQEVLKLLFIYIYPNSFQKEFVHSSKMKNRTPIWSNNFTLGFFFLKKVKTLIRKDICTPLCSLQYYWWLPNYRSNQVPINRWKNKDHVVYTYNGIFLSHKKEWNLVICNNIHIDAFNM